MCCSSTGACDYKFKAATSSENGFPTVNVGRIKAENEEAVKKKKKGGEINHQSLAPQKNCMTVNLWHTATSF